MKTVAVVGTQWGDEGKGKIVDLLAADADVVVRFQGGNNAAHTLVVKGEKFILRLIPAGALHRHQVCVIGGGTVVDPFALLVEIENLKARKHPLRPDRLKLSYEAHLVMPYHRAIDRAREARAGKRAIGTTGFGIGPAYEDKVSRQGLRCDELPDWSAFEEKLRRNIAEKNLYLKHVLKAKPIGAADLIREMRLAREQLLPYLCDTPLYLDEAVRAGKRVMFEGSQGTMLDIDHGTYPFVTSSNTIASEVFAGAGIGPGKLEAVLGITKAYTTRVGAGPLPSEISGPLSDSIREEGIEFGSATGRPRRIGWFDAVQTRHAVRVNGIWALAVTKLDVLRGVDPLRICVAYQIGARRYTEMPPGRALLARARGIYEELPGWTEDLSEAHSLSDFPSAARRYLDRIGELAGVPLAIIGTGAARDATIVLKNPFLQ
jgi:adenylosuccinate synthase